MKEEVVEEEEVAMKWEMEWEVLEEELLDKGRTLLRRLGDDA